MARRRWRSSQRRTAGGASPGRSRCMNAPSAAAHPRILGLGEHRPPNVVTNADLPAQLETDDAWIRERTGIRARRLAGPDASVVTMASDAAAKSLADSGVDAADVDLVVLATCT